MSDNLEDVFEEAIEGIAALKSFPNELQQYIENAPNYPPDDYDADFNIDIFAIFDLLYKLSIPSGSDGIAGVDSQYDTENLKKYVSQGNSEVRYLESLTSLMGFCLCEHINFELKSQGKRTIDDLWHVDGFQDYCLDMIQGDWFTSAHILTDIDRHDHLFSISWLLIADYMQDRDHAFRNFPTSGGDFQSRASYQTLTKWSYNLWASEGKGNPARMDQIVEFCGRIATVGLCPPDPTTGIQRPTPVSRVLKSFYGMGMEVFDDGDYQRDLQDSLDRLDDKEDIINEWQTYCQTFTKTWIEEIRPYWKKGIYNAFRDKQWDAIRWWEYISYDDQNTFGWGIDYLPVESQPWIGAKVQYPECTILAGTPITLSDGTKRPVEAIYPGDRLLTHASPKTATTGMQYLINQQVKGRLIGFNGESPSILSSQVFHTTTGLRAVDPEAAQRLNPYQRIGLLATGHVVFRLEQDKYTMVEIKSIRETEESTFDQAYTLALYGEQQTYHVHSYLVDTNSPRHTLRETVKKLRTVPGSKRLGMLSQCPEMWPVFQKFDGQCIDQRLNWELFGSYESPDGESPIVKNSVSYEEHLKVRRSLFQRKGIPIDSLTRGFSLTPHHPDRLPAGYQLPTLSVVDGYLLVDEEVQLRSTYDPRERCFRWSRELQQQGLFEHGAVQINSKAVSGTGVIYLSSEEESQTMPSREQVHPFKAHARSLEELPATKEVGGDGWSNVDNWELTLDRSVWPPPAEGEDDNPPDEPQDPVEGGIVENGYWTGAGGSRPTQCGAFYKVFSTLKDGINTFTVVFSRAPFVPFVSDSNTGLDIKKKFQVGFNPDLGADVTLPALYQQMTFTINGLHTKLRGYFFEYDPTKRGYKGDRHFVKGDKIKSSAVDACRSKISHAYSSVSNFGVATSFNERPQPAPVTKGLLSNTEPDLEDLYDFVGYTEVELHNETQGLIRKMMMYHMDTDQRKNILREPQPTPGTDIPHSLAEDLPQELKDFFKDKYAPAFICRYVGRTQKYSSSFTKQEMRNLWYWWEGSGPNSLSQSEHYNDINRLGSRVAMQQLYQKQLEPYMNDHPEQWAQDLHDAIVGNPDIINDWVLKPVEGGINKVNKQCNILDALSPSVKWAQEVFEVFMAAVVDQGAGSANIDDDDQDQKYQWIHDSMHDFIVAVLNGADWVTGKIEESLKEDILEFEKEHGLNQQADAEQRAEAILEKSSIFMREMASWISTIGKGLQAAFGGAALFKWAGEAIDKIIDDIGDKGMSRLKGIGSICMVGVSIVSATLSLYSLVKNWDSTSDAAKATVIIEVIGMVVDAAERGFDAFKAFKSGPATTVEDQVNMEVLNDKLSEVISENGEKFGEIAQEITGEEDYRTVIGDNLQGEGIPTEFSGEETWNEELSSVAEDVPPGYEDVAKKFNISGSLLRILNAILGIGLVVAMSFSLANDWNSLSDTGKVLGVLNVIVQGLTVLLDVIDVGAELGLYVVTGAMSVALPILGAVLAVIGVILMLVQFFINLFTGKQDPPDPIKDFINDVAHKLIAAFDKAPEPQLTYTLDNDKPSAGGVTTLTIEAVNNSSNDVTLSHTTISLYSGDDDVCLFRNGADETDLIQLVEETDANAKDDGHTYLTPSTVTVGQLPPPSKLGNTSTYYQYDLQAAGPPAEKSKSLQPLILKKGERLKSIWTGKVNGKGEDEERSTSWIELVEVGLKDKCQMQFMLTRV
ncbi:hypothetical protein ANOM_006584 [Aspergillus nomiae NRRL 13137]|uniref:Uncharacterized protein n=1 Tax=Aspergillus nomiae NRRL (strain ATCC 15546 / NRRL 13137 / CBS 260.88 / M93) TaxID=1509407 RepID=A0A0L1J3C0_ASPN3|nr:uncharacterized protein ANOM_006584 [Aspergillus nomiae NRRL 13137]KNG86160.1 hypothetical protein ANOM_006584 [Aspergillus nomiae NRRL 13137]